MTVEITMKNIQNIEPTRHERRNYGEKRSTVLKI